MNIEELFKMTEEQLAEYLEVETNKLIDNVETEEGKNRLRGLQWQIDAIRKRSSGPIDAIVQIQALMYKSLGELNDIMQGNEPNLPTKDKLCTILPLNKEDKDVETKDED